MRRPAPCFDRRMKALRSAIVKSALTVAAVTLGGCGNWEDSRGNRAPGNLLISCEREAGPFNGADCDACMNRFGHKWKSAL
jgi:hypothetical protein